MEPPNSSWRKHRNLWLLIGLSVIAVYVIVPQLGSLHNSRHLIRGAKASWVELAIGFTFLTYLLAAATYWFLAYKRLRFMQVVIVQLAAMFVNKLLPAGIGAIGANYAYLRRQNHSKTQAASVVGVNNIIGFLGHFLLLFTTLVILPGNNVNTRRIWSHNSLEHLIVIGAILLVVVLGIFLVARSKLVNVISSIWIQLNRYKSRPFDLLAALTTSIGLTLSNALCLMACAYALSINLPFSVIMIIFTFGVGVGTAIPTPGGVGGFEAGLFAGFLTYHATAPHALAAALMYRIVSYWLPLIIGAPAFIICQKKRLFVH